MDHLPSSAGLRLEDLVELHPFTKPRFDPLDDSARDLALPANVTGRADENA
jgi:hypothetical protein